MCWVCYNPYVVLFWGYAYTETLTFSNHERIFPAIHTTGNKASLHPRIHPPVLRAAVPFGKVDGDDLLPVLACLWPLTGELLLEFTAIFSSLFLKGGETWAWEGHIRVTGIWKRQLQR